STLSRQAVSRVCSAFVIVSPLEALQPKEESRTCHPTLEISHAPQLGGYGMIRRNKLVTGMPHDLARSRDNETSHAVTRTSPRRLCTGWARNTPCSDAGWTADP